MYDWKAAKSTSEAFSNIVLEGFSTTSTTFFDTSSSDASSTFLYNQFISLSFFMAYFIAFTSTNVCHTILFLVGTPFTIINNCGSGNATTPSG